MARYRVQGPDGVHVIEGPDDATPQEIEAFAAKTLTQPTAPKGAPLGRGDSVIQGMVDPINGGAQLLTKMLPAGLVEAGNSVNNWIADKTGLVAKLPPGGVDQQTREGEAAYQARRAAGGERGFDAGRLVGNVISPATIGLGAVAPAATGVGVLGRAGIGAGMGAASGALNPVANGDYWDQKAKQIALGGALGGAVPIATNALGRIISPKASNNPQVDLLRSEGVQPTVGQTLGGWANATEEKAQSIPIVGDAIRAARGRARDQFNEAAINRASGEVGVKVKGTGQAAVAEAGDAIGAAYDRALGKVQTVGFDQQFVSDATQRVAPLVSNLVPTMQDKFKRTLENVFTSRLNGQAMTGEAFKSVDSEIGQIARQYGKSSTASEQELGSALREFQSLMREQVARIDPSVAQELAAANAGYARLVRVELAAKAAHNSEGVFTPAQLNAAIRSADDSVRGRAVSRGTALMQDLGGAAQSVLGNRVPDSGTAGRIGLGLGALASGTLNPLIPASLLGGAAAYTPQVQNLLRALVSSRPQAAQPVANALQQSALGFSPAAAQIGMRLLP